MPHTRIIRPFLSAAALVSCISSTQAADIGETTNLLQQWVEVEMRIVRESNEWEADRISLENLRDVFTLELDALNERLAASEVDISAADAERARLAAEDEELRAAEAQVAATLSEAEQALHRLRARLPEPLRQELRPLFNMLPEDSASTSRSIGQRIQPIAGILTQIQRFNQVVTIVQEFREFEAGSPVQVESIYLGLGVAYYVDETNTHAGVAVAGPTGWVWRDDPSLAPLVRQFIDIYRGGREARYVNLPVEIQ